MRRAMATLCLVSGSRTAQGCAVKLPGPTSYCKPARCGPRGHARRPEMYNKGMAQHPDVMILGGGVIGLSTAYYLAREGVAVEIVDRIDFGQESSWAGAGILSPP